VPAAVANGKSLRLQCAVGERSRQNPAADRLGIRQQRVACSGSLPPMGAYVDFGVKRPCEGVVAVVVAVAVVNIAAAVALEGAVSLRQLAPLAVLCVRTCALAGRVCVGV
jgi:hypothetical protein